MARATKTVCFQVSRGFTCDLPSCKHKRVELQIVDYIGCDGISRHGICATDERPYAVANSGSELHCASGCTSVTGSGLCAL